MCINFTDCKKICIFARLHTIGDTIVLSKEKQ